MLCVSSGGEGSDIRSRVQGSTRAPARAEQEPQGDAAAREIADLTKNGSCEGRGAFGQDCAQEGSSGTAGGCTRQHATSCAQRGQSSRNQAEKS
eukprot:4500545-Pleurochrysis_carterae.AAC.4